MIDRYCITRWYFKKILFDQNKIARIMEPKHSRVWIEFMKQTETDILSKIKYISI